MEKNSLSVQQSRISNEEKELLKNTFKDREDILLAVRNLFFGFELTPVETVLIGGTFKTPEIRHLMRKIFLPELQRDIPIGQSIDLWMTFKTDNPETFWVNTQARAKMMAMVEQALACLENQSRKRVNLEILPDKLKESEAEHLFIARNTFISHVELQLCAIRILSSESDETPEEAKVRKLKDSMK